MVQQPWPGSVAAWCVAASVLPERGLLIAPCPSLVPPGLPPACSCSECLHGWDFCVASAGLPAGELGAIQLWQVMVWVSRRPVPCCSQGHMSILCATCPSPGKLPGAGLPSPHLLTWAQPGPLCWTSGEPCVDLALATASGGGGDFPPFFPNEHPSEHRLGRGPCCVQMALRSAVLTACFLSILGPAGPVSSCPVGRCCLPPQARWGSGSVFPARSFPCCCSYVAREVGVGRGRAVSHATAGGWVP